MMAAFDPTDEMVAKLGPMKCCISERQMVTRKEENKLLFLAGKKKLEHAMHWVEDRVRDGRQSSLAARGASSAVH